MINVWKIDFSAVHDGPGIRTCIYLKGCSLRCMWCSNPESQTSAPDLIFIESRCINCGLCIEKCHANALSLKRNPETLEPQLELKRSRCDKCGECTLVCASRALEVWGRRYTVEELVKIIEGNRLLYKRSGGGVTFTGGDPVFQWKAVLELLRHCHTRGIHTAIETSAFTSEKSFEQIVQNVDWLFIDLKHMDPEKHFELTGKRNDLIHKNVRRASTVLKQRKRGLILLMVVDPGINDGENIIEEANFFCSLPFITGIELLPYHRYGIAKYELLGGCYKLPDLEPAADELMEGCRKELVAMGLPII